MKICISVLCLYFFMQSLECAKRDPFSCALLVSTDQKNVSESQHQEHSKKADGQWHVKQANEKSMTLQDSDGNIREITFSDTTENKNPSTIKAEGLGGDNT